MLSHLIATTQQLLAKAFKTELSRYHNTDRPLYYLQLQAIADKLTYDDGMFTNSRLNHAALPISYVQIDLVIEPYRYANFNTGDHIRINRRHLSLAVIASSISLMIDTCFWRYRRTTVDNKRLCLVVHS